MRKGLHKHKPQEHVEMLTLELILLVIAITKDTGSCGRFSCKLDTLLQ